MARVDKLTAGDTADPQKRPFAKKRGATTVIDTPSSVPPKNTNDDARIHSELISRAGRHTGHSRKGR